MYTAIDNQDIASVKNLLNNPLLVIQLINSETGYNPVQHNEQNETLLDLAVKKNNLEIVQSLINAGCNVNACDYKFNRTPLYHAAEIGNQSIVHALLKANAYANHSDCRGITPLQIAAAAGNVEIVQALLAHNAHIFVSYWSYNDQKIRVQVPILQSSQQFPAVANLIRNQIKKIAHNSASKAVFAAIFTLHQRAGQKATFKCPTALIQPSFSTIFQPIYDAIYQQQLRELLKLADDTLE